MERVTPSRAFAAVCCLCGIIGAGLAFLGLATVNAYGVAAGAILALIWGPLLGLLGAFLAWGVRRLVLR
jgi:phosphate/sulfate permease